MSDLSEIISIRFRVYLLELSGCQRRASIPGFRLDQVARMQSPEEIPSLKSRKKQSTAQKNQASKSRNNNAQPLQDVQPPVTSTKGQRPSKRTTQNLAPTSFVNQARSPSDSLLDPSSDDAYRSLRRKYLMLEEESFLVSRETMEIEEQVRTLEDEKLALLDQLVVLEGLVDPSEFKPLSGRLP